MDDVERHSNAVLSPSETGCFEPARRLGRIVRPDGECAGRMRPRDPGGNLCVRHTPCAERKTVEELCAVKPEAEGLAQGEVIRDWPIKIEAGYHGAVRSARCSARLDNGDTAVPKACGVGRGNAAHHVDFTGNRCIHLCRRIRNDPEHDAVEPRQPS